MKKINVILMLISMMVIFACGQQTSIKSDKTVNNNLIKKNDSGDNDILTVVDKFSFRKYNFELNAENDDCILTYKTDKDEKKLKLDIPAPCKVIRFGNSAKPEGDLVRFWGNSKIKVFMVGGDVKKDKCKYETAFSYQPVVILQNEIKLGDKSNGWTCLPDGPDDTEYAILSESAIK
jgi:hypothetical protein